MILLGYTDSEIDYHYHLGYTTQIEETKHVLFPLNRNRGNENDYHYHLGYTEGSPLLIMTIIIN